MKYVSIDIETTGLNPENCQILEFGAILEDTAKRFPFLDLPRLKLYIKHHEIHGEPYAIALNSSIIQNIAVGLISDEINVKNLNIVGCVEPQRITGIFELWIDHHWAQLGKLNVAGKNYAGFDSLFLNKLPFWNTINFHHRVLDPGPMFVRATDESIPNLEECLKRAECVGHVTHTAIEDAWDVIRCIRSFMEMNHALPVPAVAATPNVR